MSKVLITTVCSPDEFSYYIPLFIYSVKRAYPHYSVKVFLTGKLSSDLKILLEKMKHWCNSDFEVLEDQFQDIPKVKKHLNNALRLFVPDEYYKGYDYGYVTDIDFLVFKHKPTLKQHYVNLMCQAKQPYIAARGPYRKPRRKEINRHGWIRKYKRVIIGRLFFKVPEFLDKTRSQRNAYYRRFIQNKSDSWDNHKPGSYREYDEVMFNRILRESKLKTPKKPSKTCAGCGIGNLYRDIHLGDFKFSKRVHSKKFYSKIKEETIAEYLNLKKDKYWQEILKVCKTKATIREAIRRLDKHIEERIGN